nr:immunoglobulin heavy chain junction region [Macaca mulatta]MOY23349.1 immunoglobulin heavy chain junction region [Macaca mulatta]MOY26367.1 immunoglobulin heavy chain junction region [Macaca mulatta]MOY30499.1 immunoglobulin heavy chain junction region [Macaca mulatta]
CVSRWGDYYEYFEFW